MAAAVLSNRYITDRFLPDKAIDLVDEAAAKLRTEMDSRPTALDEISRRVMQLEIEAVALRTEKDAASRERLRQAGEGTGRPEGRRRQKLEARWKEEKSSAPGPAADPAKDRAGPAGDGNAPCARATTARAAELRHKRLA